MRRLSHPIALGALALWIVNDQILKSHWPGIVTGKLSDIAGMIVAPLVLAVAIETVVVRAKLRAHRSKEVIGFLAFAIVGMAFALAKTWAPANDVYCATLALLRMPARLVLQHLHGGEWSESVVLVRDPTDLIALPFGLIAVRLHVPGQPDHQLS